MKKIIIGLLVISALVFGFSASQVAAQGMTLGQLVELFISLGIISPDKADAARAAVAGSSGVPTIPKPRTASPLVTLVGVPSITKVEVPEVNGQSGTAVDTTFVLSITAKGGDYTFDRDSFSFGLYRNGAKSYQNVSSHTIVNVPSSGVTVLDYSLRQFKLAQNNTISVPVMFQFTNKLMDGTALAGGLYAVGLEYVNYGDSGGKSTLDFMSGNPDWRTKDVLIEGPNVVTGTPSITVLSPSGKGMFVAGDSVGLSFAGLDALTKYNLQLRGKAYQYDFGNITPSGVGKVLYFTLPSNVLLDANPFIFVITSGGRDVGYSESFTIASVSTTQPSITVLSPNGSETYSKQGVLEIQYKSSGISGKKLIAYLYSPTLGEVRTAPGVYASDRASIYMDMSKGEPDAGQYKINICAPDVNNPQVPGKPLCDMSDGYFTLVDSTSTVKPFITVTSPNGGELFNINDNQIKFTLGVKMPSDKRYAFIAYLIPSDDTPYNHTDAYGIRGYSIGGTENTGYTNGNVSASWSGYVGAPGKYKLRVYMGLYSGGAYPTPFSAVTSDESDSYFKVVSATSPTQSMNASITSHYDGQTVMMDDLVSGRYLASESFAASVSGGSGNYKASWVFDDSNTSYIDGGQNENYYSTGGTRRASYIFNTPGTWKIGLSVVDDSGNSIGARSVILYVKSNPNPPVASTCTDSDGGQNPDVAGLTDGRVNGIGSYFNDASVASNGSTCSGDSCTSVAEGYCTSDGKVMNILTPCSTGYSAKGACTTRPVAASISVNPSSLNLSATVGQPFSSTLQATGPTYTMWNVSSGSLPSGLYLSTVGNTGIEIKGTPNQAGTYTFQLKVSDFYGKLTGTFVNGTITVIDSTPTVVQPTVVQPTVQSISVSPSPLNITMNQGQMYSQGNTVLKGSGSSQISWRVVSGSLPPGTVQNFGGTTYEILGTPNQAGTYTFQVQASDFYGVLSSTLVNCTVTVVPAPTSMNSANSNLGASYIGFSDLMKLLEVLKR